MFARLTRTLSQARQSIAGLLAADGDDDDGAEDVELDAATVWAQCVAANNAQAADAENQGTVLLWVSANSDGVVFCRLSQH